MPWLKIQTPAGPITAHVRMDKRAAAKLKCENCGRNTIDKRLCDWLMPDGKDCDAPLCEYCTVSPMEGKDLCAVHAGKWEKAT